MAIKINNITVIDDDKNVNAGIVTATSFSGSGAGLTGVGIGTTENINTTGIITAYSLNATSNLQSPSGISSDRPAVPVIGTIRWNTDYNIMEFYDGTDWRSANLSFIVPSSFRGVFGGGTPGTQNTIDYITITSQSDATDFGDLTVARSQLAACSSSTRGVFGGGSPTTNTLDYITIASAGDATNFGDLIVGRSRLAACSSSTRGVFGGGSINVIDYIAIETTGNAADFGDLSVAGGYLAACSSSTRGVFGGGYSPSVPFPAYPATNTLDYITIATTGNSTDFSDLTEARQRLSACSSSTRGVFGGGGGNGLTPSTSTNTIDYIAIASRANAIDFGDLTISRYSLAACSSSTRGVFGGGFIPSPSPGVNFNTIDYITIASESNATDFGDLTVGRRELAACSNGHGGLT